MRRPYATAFFAAHRFFIAILSALRPGAVSPRFGLALFAGAFVIGAPPGRVVWPFSSTG
jgi:hypothetical protein